MNPLVNTFTATNEGTTDRLHNLKRRPGLWPKRYGAYAEAHREDNRIDVLHNWGQDQVASGAAVDYHVLKMTGRQFTETFSAENLKAHFDVHVCVLLEHR